ncbi:hypothetical protein ACFQ0B_63010 [Nonomuraea thailandensis]
MRRVASGLTALVAVVSLGACTPAASRDAATPRAEFLVFYDFGKRHQAEAAVERAGGTTVSADTRLGYLMAAGSGAGFEEAVGADPAIAGVSRTAASATPPPAPPRRTPPAPPKQPVPPKPPVRGKRAPPRRPPVPEQAPAGPRRQPREGPRSPTRTPSPRRPGASRSPAASGTCA